MAYGKHTGDGLASTAAQLLNCTMATPPRTVVALALALLSSVAVAQRPSLKSLIAQLSCADTACMNSYVGRSGLCYWGELKGQPFWATCQVVKQKGTLRTDVPCGLMRINERDTDGTTQQGYGLSTNDPKYVNKLMKQLRGLDLTVTEKVRGGGLVYTDPNDPDLHVVHMDPDELPFIIVVIKKQSNQVGN